MTTPEVINKNEISLSRQISIVLADRQMQPMAIRAEKNGNPPTRIEVLKVGMWRTPYHGDFMITPEDMAEYVANFEAGIGFVKEVGAPIDYKHEDFDKAAGWMKSLVFEDDTLYANVEWTPQGAQMLVDGEFKCFSPSFCPKGRGGWLDPQDYEHVVDNVIVGGGLTNIPLFSGLKPVMASAGFGQKEDGSGKVFFISASNKEGNQMELEAIRAKELSTLTDEEKLFIKEKKAELTADELTKFELAEKPADEVIENKNDEGENVEVKTEVPAELASIAASIKSGESVVIKASELKELKDATSAYRQEKAEQVVKAHVARGAIKADQAPKWATRLMADASIKEDLEALPSNEILAGAIGSDTGSDNVVPAVDSIRTKVAEAIKASKEGGKELSNADAISQVRRENPELAKQYDNEING